MAKGGHIHDDNRSSRIPLGESSDEFAMTIRFPSKPPAPSERALIMHMRNKKYYTANGLRDSIYYTYLPNDYALRTSRHKLECLSAPDFFPVPSMAMCSRSRR